MHSISDGFYGGWAATVGQQGDLRVRAPTVANEAGMAPGPTGQVMGKHPPPPMPLQLLLHLENKPTVTGASKHKSRLTDSVPPRR